jgi:hypothetical protein
VDRDELRKWILDRELESRAWDLATLEVRFADGYDVDSDFDGAWRFEGVDPETLTHDTIAMILSELAVDHPPVFRLDERRDIVSWGGDGSFLTVILTVGMDLLPAAAAWLVIKDRLAESGRRAEQAGFDVPDVGDVEQYARWYLEECLTGSSRWTGSPDVVDGLECIAEAHEGSRSTFTFERQGTCYEVTLDHSTGGPLAIAYRRFPCGESEDG